MRSPGAILAVLSMLRSRYRLSPEALLQVGQHGGCQVGLGLLAAGARAAVLSMIGRHDDRSNSLHMKDSRRHDMVSSRQDVYIFRPQPSAILECLVPNTLC